MDIVTLGGETSPKSAAQNQPTAFRPAKKTNQASGNDTSVVVERCQICDWPKLESLLFLGYLPPVNAMRPIGAAACEQPAYPAQLLRCPKCSLVQLGLIVDPGILFPPSYPYTSGTTKILRDNFVDLSREVAQLYPLTSDDLVVDIGSNDGTLLGNFASRGPVLGIEPTNAAKLAVDRGIATYCSFFNRSTAVRVAAEEGKAKLVTATNVFAHIENVHDVVESILTMLTEDGIFVSESHYLLPLVQTLQYDTIYHEHLRYYSLASIKHLLEMHGMEVIHVRPIPTHGGSIRVYAARQGRYPVQPSVKQMLNDEAAELTEQKLGDFTQRVVESKLALNALVRQIKCEGKRIYGVGAPSRASTLINYAGIGDGVLDCVLEVPGSHKIGHYMPGTRVPVVEESKLADDPADCLLLLSWHIADELMPKLRAKGFRGSFIIPLPEPRIAA